MCKLDTYLCANHINFNLIKVPMLSKEEKTAFLKEATEKIAETEQKILELKELTKPISPENAIGRVSRMDAINNKSVNEAALRQLESKLQRMQLAIQKLDDPHFGSCRSCGNAIPMGRLLLLPGSTQCVKCAS